MTPLRRTRAWLVRVQGFVLGGRREREMRAEFESLLQLLIDDNIRAGLTPEEARRQALLRFGPIEAIKEAHRERASFPRLDALTRELRIASRVLYRNPAFSLAAIVTLALGIAVVSAVFSLVDAVFLRPLPYPEPERVVGIEGSTGQSFVIIGGQMDLKPDFTALSNFSALGIYTRGGLNLGGDMPSRVAAAAVSPDFFAALGAVPVAGRTFIAPDLVQDERLAVIGDRFWRERLGSDPAAVGKTLPLNGRPFTIMGIMPRGVTFPEQAELWIPAGADTQLLGQVPTFTLVGRLAPGASTSAARAELLARGRFTGTFAEKLQLMPLHDALVGPLRPIAGLVSAAALLVLLVACINGANLLLARVTARQREFSIRRAIGANRAQLVAQVLAESLVLSVVAAGLAVPIAVWLVGLAKPMLPAMLHGVDEAGMNPRALSATIALTITSAIVFGLAPALSTRVSRDNTPLQGGRASTPGRFWRRFRSGLLVAEIAISVVILTGAATLAATVRDLLAVDLGPRGENALVMRVTLPRASLDSAEKVRAFYLQLQETLGAIPGVERVGVTHHLPGVAPELLLAASIAVDNVPPPPKRAIALRLLASENYFSALGIPLIAGREFSPGDATGAPVAIVSEGYARRLGLEPSQIIGERAAIETTKGERAEVIGVVRDVKIHGPERPSGPAIYLYAGLEPLTMRNGFIVVKGYRDPTPLVPALREAAARLAPDAPLYDIRLYDDLKASLFADRRFAMFAMVLFGGLAFGLSAVGLYGVIAYLVQLRTREIGIRIALGATPGRVRYGVLSGGVGHAAAGVAAGVALALGSARFVAGRVPGVTDPGPMILAGIALSVMLVAALAAAIPAWRATRVDPMLALRAE